MKKFKYKMIGNLYEMAFPKKLLKERRDFLIIIMEACRFMMQNEAVNHADNLMVLMVNDMNRLLFCKENKMYSVSFPFHVECYPAIHFDYNKIDIDSSMISNICNILNSSENEERSFYDFADAVLNCEELFSKEIWYVLKHLLTYEIGYIRYDDDYDGFITASNAGRPKCHPRYHFDVNYSQQAAFKIGLEKPITPDKFIEFLDDTQNRKILKT